MEKIIENKDKKLKYFIEDYWDIFLGIISIMLAFYFHKMGQGGIVSLPKNWTTYNRIILIK